jgi:hypothetical protein
MPDLHEMSGRVVDLRRHTNVHLYRRGRLGPTERYELWLRDTAGGEHQFIVHARTMPARCGHEITLLVGADRVRGLINWSTGRSVNYVRVDPLPLWRLRDLLAPPVLLAVLSAWRGVCGLLLFLPATLLYFLIMPMLRGVIRLWHGATTGHALRHAQRVGKARRALATRRQPD